MFILQFFFLYIVLILPHIENKLITKVSLSEYCMKTLQLLSIIIQNFFFVSTLFNREKIAHPKESFV